MTPTETASDLVSLIVTVHGKVGSWATKITKGRIWESVQRLGMGFSSSCLPDLQDEQCALFFVFFVPFVASLFLIRERLHFSLAALCWEPVAVVTTIRTWLGQQLKKEICSCGRTTANTSPLLFAENPQVIVSFDNATQ